MSHRPSSAIYSNNANTSSISQSQSSALQARITQKRAELENLKQLRDLSAQLAQQMSALESRLATLRNGTESVAEVLRNWSGVVRVLGMAGEQLRTSAAATSAATEAETDDRANTDAKVGQQLPATLVRIPIPVSVNGHAADTAKEKG